MGNNCGCEADFSTIDKMGAVDVKIESIDDQLKNSKQKLKPAKNLRSNPSSNKNKSKGGPSITKEAGGTGGTDGPLSSAKAGPGHSSSPLLFETKD